MDTKKKQFRHAVMMKVADVSNDSLQNWLKRGVLTLDTTAPRARRLYSAEDVFTVAIMQVCIKQLRLETRYASDVAGMARQRCEELDQDATGQNLRLCCWFKGENLESLWVTDSDAYGNDILPTQPHISIPVKCIFLHVAYRLEMVLYGPPGDEAYENMSRKDAKVAKADDLTLYNELMGKED